MSDERPPNDEERVLAAACHLAIFLAVPIVAPIAVYLWKRKESRFVAFHAIQATLVAILAIPVSLLGWILLSIAGVALTSAVNREAAALVGIAAFILGMGVPWLVTCVVACVAGFKALKGSAWSIPLVGRLAKSVVDAGPVA